MPAPTPNPRPRRRPGAPHKPAVAAVAAAAAIAIAATVLLAGCAGSGPTGAAACRSATVAAVGEIAHRIYDEAHTGPNAVGYARLLARTKPLIDAVARNDAAATQAAVTRLLSFQIIHIRITGANGAVLADLGKPDGLAPVSGQLQDAHGNVIGGYLMSVQDARAFVMVLSRLTDADVVLRSGARQLLGTLTPGPATIPSSGAVSYGGRRYQALSFGGQAFPADPLRISVLIPFSAARHCPSPPAAARAQTLGGADQRIYEEEVSSGNVTLTIDRLRRSAQFVAAIARGDRAAVLRSIKGFFRLHQFHVVRVRVMRGSKLLADLGGPFVLGPARGVVRDRRGRTIGSFLVAVQDDSGYLKLAQRFTGAGVVLSSGGSIVMSTPGTPPAAALPDRGLFQIGGHSYRVYSFTGQAFPSGPLRISLLFPGR